jgi:hypothetical protein
MKNKNSTRKGSGRTKGSFSFVKIPLIELNAKIKDSATQVVVRRKWAEAQGFVGLAAQPVDNSQDRVKPVTDTDSPESAVTTVDNGAVTDTTVAVADKL